MQLLRGRRGTTWVAMLATLVLVVQALLSGMAASAAPATVDAFGNVICTSHSSDPVDHDESGHRPNCCIVGCTFAAALEPPASGALGIAVNRRVEFASALPRTDEARPVGRRGTPGNPRAPPFAA
jgi:hypothetical protein